MATTIDDQSELLLVLRAQSGDRDALDQLLARHQRQLYGYLIGILQDEPLAEDSLQAAFLQVYRKLKWLRDPALFRSWLYRIASRTAIRLAKKKRKRQEVTNLDLLDNFASDSNAELPTDESSLQELTVQIPAWLDRLTHNGREAVVLHYLKGFTVPEVADILDIPLGTAKSRISYALASIRKFANIS